MTQPDDASSSTTHIRRSTRPAWRGSSGRRPWQSHRGVRSAAGEGRGVSIARSRHAMGGQRVRDGSISTCAG